MKKFTTLVKKHKERIQNIKYFEIKYNIFIYYSVGVKTTYGH